MTALIVPAASDEVRLAQTASAKRPASLRVKPTTAAFAEFAAMLGNMWNVAAPPSMTPD